MQHLTRLRHITPYNTSPQHYISREHVSTTTLHHNTSPHQSFTTLLQQHSFTTLLYDTSPQHPSQHFSTTLPHNTSPHHFPTTLLYITSPQHFSTSLHHITSPQHFSTTLFSTLLLGTLLTVWILCIRGTTLLFWLRFFLTTGSQRLTCTLGNWLGGRITLFVGLTALERWHMILSGEIAFHSKI